MVADDELLRARRERPEIVRWSHDGRLGQRRTLQFRIVIAQLAHCEAVHVADLGECGRRKWILERTDLYPAAGEKPFAQTASGVRKTGREPRAQKRELRDFEF